MTPANFDPHTRSITFLTKGKVQQTLPASKRVADSFVALDPDADPQLPVIYQLSGKTPGRKPQRFSKQWKKLKAKLKLRPELRIHDLRRTMAEDVWQATLDIRCVQAQLGHRSPTTTARYLANRIGLQQLQPIAAMVEALRAERTAKEQSDREQSHQEQSHEEQRQP
jgi:integrase